MDDDGNSDFEEIASDLENEDELREWLSSTHVKTKGLIPGEALVRKYMPPGTIADLYEHYKSTQQLLGNHAVSYFNIIGKAFGILFDRWLVPKKHNV